MGIAFHQGDCNIDHPHTHPTKWFVNSYSVRLGDATVTFLCKAHYLSLHTSNLSLHAPQPPLRQDILTNVVWETC